MLTNLLTAIILSATWERFADDGKLAANGLKYSTKAMTCATWRFPLGSRLKVEDTHNHSVCVVTVTDRPARIFQNRIDLSPAAFCKLNGLVLGKCEVKVFRIN